MNDLVEEISSTTGTDGQDHPLVVAKLAVLEKRFKMAEAMYLEQGMVDKAMEMYQELHKWDDSLEIAARKVYLSHKCLVMYRTYVQSCKKYRNLGSKFPENSKTWRKNFQQKFCEKRYNNCFLQFLQ